MRIGIISDTHDRLPALDRGLEELKARDIQAIIHPGDVIAPFAAKRLLAWAGPLHIVYGNNDGERAGLKNVLPQIQDGPLWVNVEGCRILVHHFIDWCDPEDVASADVTITGHTHEVVVDRRGDRLIFNPGECCGWLTGRCTVAVLETETREVDVIEVGRD